MTKFKIELLFLLLLLSNLYCAGQDISTFPTAHKDLTITGYISTNHSNNFQSENNIYSGLYSGNITFSTTGFSVPLTFIYTNQKTNFSHPFNQFAIHPSYKWIQTHIGTVSMSMSPYTLNGHLFTGAGLELTPPGNFTLSLMHGRLKKSIVYDSANNIEPQFRRMGSGILIGYKKNKDQVSISIFKAKDIEEGIAAPSVADNSIIIPQENAAIAIKAGTTILERLSINAEFGSSTVTKDTRMPKKTGGNSGFDLSKLFLTNTQSTISRNALRAYTNYSFGQMSIGVGYERVDPEFLTFGTYYFTNNLENMIFNLSTTLSENKINLSGNIGLQKDNLDKNKMNNTKRLVSSGNIGYTPTEKINLNVGYSNFSSYTNVRSTFDYINQTDPIQTWDSLNFRQISQNLNLNGNYQISNDKKKRQSIGTNLTYQISNDRTGLDSLSTARFYNLNTSFNLSFVPQSLSISTSLNINKNEILGNNSFTWGPGVNISKMYFEQKLRTTASFNYNTSRTYSGNGSIFNFRLGCTVILKKIHNFNINGLSQWRTSYQNQTKTVRNSGLISLGYIYNFNLLSKNTQKNGIDQ